MDRRIQQLLANPKRLLENRTVSAYDRNTLKHTTLQQKLHLILWYINTHLPKLSPTHRRQKPPLNNNNNAVLLKKAMFLRTRAHRKGRHVKVTPAHHTTTSKTPRREVEIVVRPQGNRDTLPVAFKKGLISRGLL